MTINWQVTPNKRHLESAASRSGRYRHLVIRWVGSFLLLVTVSTGLAQKLTRVGTTAAPFLKISVGARALGMGEAYTTLAEDITGLFWNPAGIANQPKSQMLFNYYDYLADLYYDFGAYTMPIQNVGTIGIFFSYLGMPDIERTTIDFPEGNGEKAAANSFAVGLSYARALTDRFSIGGNVKYVRETIWHSHATGLAFDLGMLYRAFFKDVYIGMNISNFGGDMQMSGRDMLVQHDINQQFSGNNENINANLETEAFPLPIMFRVGLSANLGRNLLGFENYDWILAVDAIHPNDNREYINLGSEIRLRKLIALRAGYRQLFLEDREGGMTFGFGLKIPLRRTDLNLDYAYVDFGRMDSQHKYSLIFSF